MSGRHAGRTNAYNSLNPHNSSFSARACSHYPSSTGPAGGFKYSRASSAQEFGGSDGPCSLSPVRRICMGRPYNAKCVETSHLARRPREPFRSLSDQGGPCCLTYTDTPQGSSGPSFLDHLIKGITYLDRSAGIFNKSSLSLPKLAASYLEQAANSIQLDAPERPYARSYSNPSASPASSDVSSSTTSTSTCVVPVSRSTRALQCPEDPVSRGCVHRYYSPRVSPTSPQRPGVKLPEIPLFTSGVFALRRLPKVWEAIRSGLHTPEPVSKPSWW